MGWFGKQRAGFGLAEEQDLGGGAEPSTSREAADASESSCPGQMRDTGLPKLQKSNSSLFVDDRARSVTGC